MRISDWSSDVCSSDLRGLHLRSRPRRPLHRRTGTRPAPRRRRGRPPDGAGRAALGPSVATATPPPVAPDLVPGSNGPPALPLVEGWMPERVRQDRKSVVAGKSVSVRVGVGGRRIIKKKKTTNINE